MGILNIVSDSHYKLYISFIKIRLIIHPYIMIINSQAALPFIY